MASLAQTGISTGSGHRQWALEQRFPKPGAKLGRATNLNRLQSIEHEVACVVYCGTARLGASDNGNFGVFFRIEPSPLQSRFVLDLRFGPANKQTVISASFSAYDDFNGNRQFRRTPHHWTGTHGNIAPRGPLDFSRQLYQVTFRTGADLPAAPLNFRDLAPDTQLNFSWQSDLCVRYGFGYPHAGLPADVVQAIDNFRAILDQATIRRTRLGVVTKNAPRMPTLFWPWFCCQPSPSVASWWPWVRPLNNAEPGSIMDFSASNFELNTAYFNKALGIRQDDWNVPGTNSFQDANTIPQPLSLACFKAVHRFVDHREYLAHVLGSHGYESVRNTSVRQLYRKIIEMMTGGDSFWKTWLLAQDNFSLDCTASNDDLPVGWQQQVDAAITRARLTAEQAQVVRRYFQRKVTIVVGPPGTGKSTLVGVILSLEKAFKCRYWSYAGGTARINAPAPHGLVMDDSSRCMEADAVAMIVHAKSQEQLRRVLIIGDQNQLHPPLRAGRNPFSSTGRISLMERQILAGTSYLQLRTQFRMHPSISQVVNMVSYENTLLNSVATEQRPEVNRFKRYMRDIASDSGLTSAQAGRLDTCSFILSPAPSKAEFPHFGSQITSGSQSRHNLQTAMMVFRKVYWLVKLGDFGPEQILVRAFYEKQVELLNALFQDLEIFDRLKINTVEGSSGEERLVHVIDCVSLGGGADESLLGSDKRLFNVAMSRSKVGRIAICSKDFIKGKFHGGCWKELLEDSQTVVLGDGKFRTAFESKAMKARFEEVRKTWAA